MYDQAGIWINQRKALVVTLTPEGPHTTLILSKVEKHPEQDERRQRALTGALNTYYDGVIATVREHFERGAVQTQACRVAVLPTAAGLAGSSK